MITAQSIQKIARVTGLAFVFFSLIATSFGQNSRTDDESEKVDSSSIYGGLKFRSIGPALMSGRIADIVIHPNNQNVWYVAVGSGGVWKRENSGTTWSSLFDGQVSYSIRGISLDPQEKTLAEDTLATEMESIRARTEESHGRTWGYRNQNTFRKLLFIQPTLTSYGLPHKVHCGVAVVNEVFIKLQMVAKPGIVRSEMTNGLAQRIC